MRDFNIHITEIDVFLDELRARGPNVENVVRITREPGIFMRPEVMRATYLRAYGDRCGTVEFVGQLGVWFSLLARDLTPEQQQEEDRARLQFAQDCAARYDEFVGRIREAAGPIGIAIAGGIVRAGDD